MQAELEQLFEGFCTKRSLHWNKQSDAEVTTYYLIFGIEEGVDIDVYITLAPDMTVLYAPLMSQNEKTTLEVGMLQQVIEMNNEWDFIKACYDPAHFIFGVRTELMSQGMTEDHIDRYLFSLLMAGKLVLEKFRDQIDVLEEVTEPSPTTGEEPPPTTPSL